MSEFVIRDWPHQVLNKSEGYLEKVVLEFTRTALPNTLCCLGVGSAFRNEAGEYSDIDIILINEGTRVPSRIQTVRAGHALQISVFDLAGCFKQIDLERQEGRPFYLHAICNSKFLDGSRSIHQLLLNYTKGVLASPPDRCDPKRLERLRIAAANKFLSLMSAQVRIALLERVVDLMNLVRKIASAEAGRWGYTLDYLSDDNFDPKLRSLMEALANSTASDDLEEIKDQAQALMSAAGLIRWSSPEGVILPLRVG